VAHSLSAKKRVRQNVKRRARNRARKDLIKVEMKAYNAVLVSGDMAKAEEQLRKVVQRLDKTAAKGTIHKNTAARKRSRLTKRLNRIRSGELKATAAGHGKGAKAAKAPAGAGTGGVTA
jgi:small subunit ribosomal protein S20